MTGLPIDDLADSLRNQAGLTFAAHRRQDFVRTVQRILDEIGPFDPESIHRGSKLEPVLFDRLMDELTVNETYFFRTPEHFNIIRHQIVPELLSRTGAGQGLRVWSAGCASGEEPYSLAILFEEMGLSGAVHILATDISRAILARASAAIYRPWSFRGDATRLLGRYFRPEGDAFKLDHRIRRRVEFSRLNLAEDLYPSPATKASGLDLILCRNVLIYLDPETISEVAKRFHHSLAPGGYLIIGPSDPLLGELAPFETVVTPAGVLYRRNAAARQCSLPAIFAPSKLDAPTNDQRTRPESAIVYPSQAVSHWRSRSAKDEAPQGAAVTNPRGGDAESAAHRLRALARHGDLETANEVAWKAAAAHPTSTEIGFLHAVLLMDRSLYDEAEQVLRRVLYMDRSLAVAWFALGTALQRLGRLADALGAYRIARSLAADCSPADVLPLSDDEPAERLAKAAEARIADITSVSECPA